MLITYLLFSTLLSCFGKSKKPWLTIFLHSEYTLFDFGSAPRHSVANYTIRSSDWDLRADVTSGYCDVYILLAQSNPS